MADSTPKPGWYRPTPDRLILALLVAECLLWLSQRFQWFGFNHHKGWTVLIAVAAVGAAFLLMLLWFIAGLLFRWRFQFGIRSLLVLTVVVAVPCSWLAVEMKKARVQKEAIVKLGAVVDYDFKRDMLGNPIPSEPDWLRNMLGDDFFQQVEYLQPTKAHFSDADWERLKEMKTLQTLHLNGTDVTDAGLKHLKELTQLQVLELDGTEVTGAGLENLNGLTQLHVLSLENIHVTDAGLEGLVGLTRLRLLTLEHTQVTDAGVAKLQQALPKCRIYH